MLTVSNGRLAVTPAPGPSTSGREIYCGSYDGQEKAMHDQRGITPWLREPGSRLGRLPANEWSAGPGMHLDRREGPDLCAREQ